MTLIIFQGEEWPSTVSQRPQQGQGFPFEVPGVWAEHNTPGSAQNTPPSDYGAKERGRAKFPKTMLHPLQGTD